MKEMPSETESTGVEAIHVDGLSHTFRTRSGPLEVLRDIHLTLPAGGYLSLTGPSGAGKSTLLALLGGLEPVQEGRITVGDVDLAGLSRDQLAGYRGSTVGFVFQHFGLLDTLSAAENVALAGTLSGMGRREREERSHQLLASVGLAARADHRPYELSGGERQRVAIARALANDPKLVLADEPTGNLDDDSTALVIDLLESLPERIGCTLLLVTHDRGLARRATNHVHLDSGRLLSAGPASSA